jgi:hypothetical protein
MRLSKSAKKRASKCWPVFSFCIHVCIPCLSRFTSGQVAFATARASLNLRNSVVLSEEVEASQIDTWKYFSNCDRNYVMGGCWTSCSYDGEPHSKNFRRS